MRRLIFPARLILEDGSDLQPVSVWVGPDVGTQVYGMVDGRIERVYASDQEPVLGARYEWTIGSPDGTVHIEKASGCGCGHPLKRFRPALTGPSRVGT